MLSTVLLILAFEELGVNADGFGGVVAGFLEGLDFAGEAALDFDELGVFLRGGEQFGDEVWPEQNSGEVGSGGLKADFREFAGVMATEELGEVVLEDAEFQGAVLGGAPFLIAAAGFPVGDVTLSDAETRILRGPATIVLWGRLLAEHAIDQFAFGLGRWAILPLRGRLKLRVES